MPPDDPERFGALHSDANRCDLPNGWRTTVTAVRRICIVMMTTEMGVGEMPALGAFGSAARYSATVARIT